MWWPCSKPEPAPTPYAGPMTDPFRWSFTYSPGMPAQPLPNGNAFMFNLPVSPGSVHYLTTPINRPIVGPMKLDARVDASPDVVYNYKIADNNQGDGGMPAGVHLYFQRRGDDLSGAGEYEFYRWWSSPLMFALKDGSCAINVPMIPDAWISVYGKSGTLNPAAFNNAIANCGSVGMTFGGGSFMGHGVNLLAGSARFFVDGFSA